MFAKASPLVRLIILLLATLLMIAISTLLLFIVPTANASNSLPVQGSHPLDCIHWRIENNSGNGPLVRVLVCSKIPKDQGGDSPARDSTNWMTLIVDGDEFKTDACGTSWLTPCVIFPR